MRTVFDQMRLILVFVFIGTLVCQAEDRVTGRWEGTMNVPDREMTLVVDLDRTDGASWRGSAIIPNLNLTGALLSDISVNESSVSFMLKAGRGLEIAFKGNLSGEGTFSGDFTQAGNSASFTLKKVGPPQVAQPPRSTSVTKEIEGEWKGEYQVFGAPRHVTLKVTNGEKGGTAEFVVVGKKVNNLPVDLVTQEGNLLTIDSHRTGISYEGRIDKSANEIKGTFVQGPIELPLILRRSK